MDHGYRLLFLAMIVVGATSGCATETVMKAARETTRQQVAGAVRLASASRDAEAGYLCIHRTAPDASVETYWVRIPIAESRYFYITAVEDQPAVIKMTTDQIKFGACESVGEPMAIIDVVNQDKVVLAAGQKEAVYVHYVEGSLQDLGYVTARPFFNGRFSKARYSYAIDLSETSIFSERAKARPYLLVLVPLAVAVDVVVGTATFVAVVMGEACGKRADGCSWGR
jgi:hypothetical protein